MPKRTSKTGSELFIVDNSDEDWKVLRYLHDWCQLSKAIDIATGYFEIGGILALADEWQKVDAIRVLMGDEVSKRTKAAFAEGLKNIERRLNDSLEAEKEKNDFLRGVPAVVVAIRSGKIQCRVYRKDKFHAKCYLTHGRQEVVGSFGLVGSSNFTFPGITQNIELNVQVTGTPVTVLQEWYDEHWQNAEDVTPEVLKIIERHTREYAPFEVYAKSLQEFFRGHELTVSEWETSQSRMFDVLDQYQKEGYQALVKKAHKYGGAFLCDGVGLGKTFVGLMLIERLIMHEGKNVALFVPKAAADPVWRPAIKKYLPHIGRAFTNLQLFNHTDLQRGGDFEELLADIGQRADVIIIDEAHHFRNPGHKAADDFRPGAIRGEGIVRPSRYRRMYDLVERILPFRNADVCLETIAQGRIDWGDFAGRLLYVVQQEAKHGFLRDLSRNSLRGLLNMARKGDKFQGPLPFGYCRGDAGTFDVAEDQAAIIRRIFNEYLAAGGSVRRVCHSLNSDGILSPTGKLWRSATVRLILRNRWYTGAYVWGKAKSGRYHSVDGGEIVTRRKSDKTVFSDPCIIKEDSHEAIIDKALFQRVQAKLTKAKVDTSPLRSGDKFALTGLLRCGNCDSSMCGESVTRAAGRVRRYKCSGYSFRHSCTHNTIPEAPLLDALARIVEQEYLSERNLKLIREEAYRTTSAPKQNVVKMRKRLADLDRQMDQGTERMVSAPATVVPRITKILEKLDLERSTLAAQLAGIDQEDDDQDDRETQAESAIAALRDIRRSIRTAPPEALRELLHKLISRIELHFIPEQHGKYTFARFEKGTVSFRPDPKISSLVRAGSSRNGTCPAATASSQR